MTACPFCELELPEPDDEQRSYPQLRRFFGMIRAAIHHWPETHPVQLENEKQARSWLLVRAGHGTVQGAIPVHGMPTEAAREIARKLISLSGAHAVAVVRGGELLVVTPKSIAFGASEAGHKRFCELSDRVQAEIERVCGARMEDLLSSTPAPGRRFKREARESAAHA